MLSICRGMSYLLLQEVSKGGQECLGILLEWGVARFGDEDQLRIRNEPVVRLAKPRRYKTVIRTPNQQRREIDPGHPLSEIRASKIRICQANDGAPVAHYHASISLREQLNALS